MGTWGAGSFQNDCASDWVYDLEASNDLSLLHGTLEQLPYGEYLDVDVG